MSSTPAGSLSLALDVAKTTLQASTAWIAAVAARDPDGDFEHLLYYSLDNDNGIAEQYPLALLRYASRGSNPIAEGISVDLVVGGGILLLIEELADPQLGDQDSYIEFCNLVGKVIDEMELLSGEGDYLPFQSEMLVAPQRTKRAEQSGENDYWQAVFLLRYGDQM
jgi:hypothetical protein